MKRAALLLILGLCLVGVVYLLTRVTGGRVTHRDACGGAASGPASARRAGDLGGGAGAVPGGESHEAGSVADDDPNRRAGPPVTLRGRVERDGRGMAAAVVTARRAYPWFNSWSYRWARRELDEWQPPIAKTETVDEGTFELTIARRRAVVLWAEHPGSGPASLTLLLPETGDPDEVTLRLKDGATLYGVVLDEEAQPVAGAAVRLETVAYWWSAPFRHDTKTEPDGRFVYHDLAEGGASVLVEASGYPSARRSITLSGTDHIRFVLCPGGTVFGRVTDSGGAPLADARILLATADAAGHSGRADVRSDADGEYRVESIRPGALTSASVVHPSCGVQVTGRREIRLPTRLVRAGEVLRYDIRLEPGVPVRGRTVMVDGERPVAGAQVALLQMNSGWRGLSEIASAVSGEDGRFVFPHVAKGTYAFEATAPGAGRRAVRRVQGNRPLTVDLYVDGERAPPEQRVELSPMGGVRGSVVGYVIRPEWRLTVQMQTEQGNISGQVDDVGHFVFDNVPPTEGAVVQSWNPQAKSEPFAVEAGRVTEVALELGQRGGYLCVVEDEQGHPIDGASVQAIEQGSLRWTLKDFVNRRRGAERTDETGRCLALVADWYYENRGTQRWVVVASHPEFALGMSEAQKLPAKGETTEVRIVLEAAGAVRGCVEFEGGAPAPNVRVTAGPKKVQGGPPWETRGSRYAMTDFDGRFEIAGIAEGPYSVWAYHRDGKVEAVDAHAGDEDLRLVIRACASICGFVVDEEGRPVRMARVSAIVPAAGGERKHSANSGEGGRFEITHLDPGAYPLVVESPAGSWSAQNLGFEPKRVDAVNTGTEELVIVVSYGPTLEGRVLGHGGKPLAGVGVIAMPLQIGGENDDPLAQQRARQQAQQQTRPSTVTDGRGEFEIRGLGSIEVELIALAPGHAPATRRAVAGGGRVTLRLDRGGVIEGRLLKADGKPLAHQWFSLRPAPEIDEKLGDWRARAGQSWNYLGGWQLTQGRTGPDGTFEAVSLVPGEYLLQVSTGEGVLPATKLSTDTGAVTLRLQPPLTVCGRVVDAEGRTIAPDGFRLAVSARQGQSWLRSAEVGSDGMFEIRGLPPGTVTLQVWATAGYLPATVVVAAGDQHVTIVLQPRPTKPK